MLHIWAAIGIFIAVFLIGYAICTVFDLRVF